MYFITLKIARNDKLKGSKRVQTHFFLHEVEKRIIQWSLHCFVKIVRLIGRFCAVQLCQCKLFHIRHIHLHAYVIETGYDIAYFIS